MKDFHLNSIISSDKPVNTYSPGQMLSFSANFTTVPDKYRLQILDGNNNARLNHYGKGSSKGINIQWTIPKTIREKHMSRFWQISIDTESESFKLFFEVKNIRNFLCSE
jgi:hypothetical protein